MLPILLLLTRGSYVPVMNYRAKMRWELRRYYGARTGIDYLLPLCTCIRLMLQKAKLARLGIPRRLSPFSGELHALCQMWGRDPDGTWVRADRRAWSHTKRFAKYARRAVLYVVLRGSGDGLVLTENTRNGAYGNTATAV